MNDFTFSQPSPPTGEPKLLPQPRKASMREGAAWVGQAFRLYKRRWAMWTGMVAVILLLTTVLSVVPWIGFIGNFLGLLFAGGLMMSADALSEGDQLEFGYLFAGFKYKFADLLRATLIYIGVFLLLMLVMAAVFTLTGGTEGMLADLGGTLENPANGQQVLDSRFYLLVLLMLFFAIPATMMIWFAPALITLNDMKAWPAMKLSLQACMQNIAAFFAYFAAVTVVFVALAFACSLLMAVDSLSFVGIALFVVLMLMFSAMMVLGQFASYRSVLTDKPLP